jgi:hypothetical protein
LPPKPKTVPCPDGVIDKDGNCIPFNVLMGEKVTIFQGPDCWPKEFTIRKPFDPALKGIIAAAIRRETRGLTPMALSRKLAASPRLVKRIRTSRSVRRPG